MKRQQRLAKYEYRRKRKKFLNRLFLLFFVCIVGLFILNKSGFFNVSDIIVEGNEKLKDTDVIKASGLDVGKNYFSISEKDRVEDLEKIPLVKSAKLKFSLKKEATITIVERVPKYQIENFLEYYTLDENLRILSLENSRQKLPVIEADFENLTPGNYVSKDEETLAFFKELISQPIYQKLQSINLKQNKKYMMTEDGVQIVMGNFENIDYKFKMLKEILNDIEVNGKNAKRIEMDKKDPVVEIVEEQEQ